MKEIIQFFKTLEDLNIMSNLYIEDCGKYMEVEFSVDTTEEFSDFKIENFIAHKIVLEMLKAKGLFIDEDEIDEDPRCYFCEDEEADAPADYIKYTVKLEVNEKTKSLEQLFLKEFYGDGL